MGLMAWGLMSCTYALKHFVDKNNECTWCLAKLKVVIMEKRNKLTVVYSISYYYWGVIACTTSEILACAKQTVVVTLGEM